VSDENARHVEVPPGLTREEERAIILALERHLTGEGPGPGPWTMAGRLDGTGMGALQTRWAEGAWQRAARSPFARRGVPPYTGRGDAK